MKISWITITVRAGLLALAALFFVACPAADQDLSSQQTQQACGDQVVDSGEECDDGEASATCNADCTRAECGDGVLNINAGESCDDDGESVSCDSDCTAVVCGDGLVNVAAGESCDDEGESVSCDSDCTAVVCGDGLVNATAGESCDDEGESVNCDSDCTAVVCGDGLVNATAGESCDDEVNDGSYDGCDTYCKMGPRCGDSVINGSELCDGADVDGTECIDLGEDYSSGDLACATNCQSFDTSACVAATTGEICTTAQTLDVQQLPLELIGTFAQSEVSADVFSCNANSHSNIVWYTFTPVITATHHFSAANATTTSASSRFVVLEGNSCSPLSNELLCETSDTTSISTSVALEAGASYLVAFLSDGADYTMVDPVIDIYPEGICGNGVVDDSEDCDEGLNGDGSDGCTDNCTFTSWDVAWCQTLPEPEVTESCFGEVELYSQFYIPGATDQSTNADVYAGIIAEVGYGNWPDDPSTVSDGQSWLWFSTLPNLTYTDANNDEYTAFFPPPQGAPLLYFAYGSRVSTDGGVTWVYCDITDSTESPITWVTPGFLRIVCD